MPFDRIGRRPITRYAESVQVLIDNLISEAQGSLASALGQFEDLVEEVLTADPDNFAAVNDAIISLLETVTDAGEGLSDVVEDAFGTWGSYLGQSIDAAYDLIVQLFDRFVGEAAVFRAMIEAWAASLPDFPALFHELCRRTASSPAEFRDALEAVLLPSFVAGAAALGPDVAVEAITRVLRDDGGTLGTRSTVFDLGLAGGGLPAWQSSLLGHESLRLTRGAWSITALLEALRKGSTFAGLLPDSIAIPNEALQAVFAPVVQTFGPIVTNYIEAVDELIEAVVTKLLNGAENDAEIEWLVLQVGRFTPVGLLFLLVAIPWKLFTNPAPWLELVLNPIESNPNLRVKRLDPPTLDTRYIILSDVHRDAKSDARPPFQFGSIDHFLPSADLYADLLKYYDEAGYIIIEAGDCEELWFHRDFTRTPTEKLAEILDTHHEIYERLARLHADGRYFRVFGNHDSYLRDSETFEVLRARMESAGSEPFDIHDFLIVPGVKTMKDVPFYLGLDSDPNTSRRPLIVTHGHQWDFWNCDSNNILGKLIVTAIVTPLDMLDDPLRDLAGISSAGSPAVNFKSIISGLPVFNSWPSYESAVRLADRVKQMEDEQRRFVDDVQYSETLASLMGLLIPVAPGPDDECGLTFPSGRCLLNLLTIGHTHNPQNEPYYDLKVLPFVKEVLTGLESQIAAATQGMVNVELGLVKSQYLNSGVSGWYDDCVWGIELGDLSHGSGQPRLVYWTYNTRVDRPNTMHWELPHLPRDGSPRPGDLIETKRRELLDMVSDLFAAGRDRAIEILSSASVGDIAARITDAWKPVDLEARFDGKTVDIFGQVVFQCLGGLLSGQKGRFSVKVDLPNGVEESLHRVLKSHLPGPRRSTRARLAAAIGTVAVLDDVGRFGLRREIGPQANADRSAIGLLLLLAQLQESRADWVDARLTLDGGRLVAEILVDAERAGSAVGRPEPRPKPQPVRPSRPGVTIPPLPKTDGKGKVRRGVLVRAFVAGSGAPLSGWTVALERRSGGQTETLARVPTNRDGEARLLRLRPSADQMLVPGHRGRQRELSLVLSSPEGKQAIRRSLDLDTPVEEISLPVSIAVLRTIGFFGAKIRSVDEKTAAVCDMWKQRKAKDRSGFADDVWLNDLMLSALGGIDNPTTPLQEAIVKALSDVEIGGKKVDDNARKAAANHARDARKRLEKCLGGDYRKCDASGSLEEIAKRLINDNGRFRAIANLFDDPEPDPEQSLSAPKAGLGIPSSSIEWKKDCLGRFATGNLDDATRDVMAEYFPDGRVLAQPRINLVEVWDPAFLGGETVRTVEVHNKILNLRVLRDSGGNLERVDYAVNLDVELDDPRCLVHEADATGRQVAVTDVSPGQKITLRGSGFVDVEAEVVEASRRAWEPEQAVGTDALVPDGNVVSADGLVNAVFEVHGQELPIENSSTPYNYNGDRIVFEWPAAREGLYRLRLRFRNTSEYPTRIEQADDCSLTVDRGDVYTQYIYFAVLPDVSLPPVRIVGRDVECVNLTDPEGFLGIPWPDDVLFEVSATRMRIDLTSGDHETTVESTLSESFLFFGPGLWSPALRVFPSEQTFAQLPAFEAVFADFRLLEVEGDFDRFAAQLLYIAALVALTLIVAAVVVAILVGGGILAVLAGLVTAGVAAKVVIALAGLLLTFVFGAAFGAFLGLTAMLNAVIDGSDDILEKTLQIDGSRLAFRLSPIAFHRLMYPTLPMSTRGSRCRHSRS
ncbi:MAG: hypothetical protein R3C59_14430 [Planctomycetaceae bacterium]